MVMRTYNLQHFLSQASTLPFVKQGRLYQKQMALKLHTKTEQVLSTFSVSVGVFDGEFEEVKKPHHK